MIAQQQLTVHEVRSTGVETANRIDFFYRNSPAGKRQSPQFAVLLRLSERLRKADTHPDLVTRLKGLKDWCLRNNIAMSVFVAFPVCGKLYQTEL